LKNSLNEILLSENNFSKMLNRKRDKDNSKNEGIEDFLSLYKNEIKEKNKNKIKYNNVRNFFSNDKRLRFNEIFNNKDRNYNINSTIFNKNGNNFQKGKTNNIEKLSERSMSNFENSKLLKYKLTNKQNHFQNNKFDLYNNIEKDVSDMNFNLDSKENSVLMENEKDLYKYKTKSNEKKKIINSNNKNSQSNNYIIYKAKIQNFFEDYNYQTKETQNKVSNYKQKESDSIKKSNSSENIDINEIKQESSSVKSLRSRTKNEFEKLEVDIGNLPDKMQLRDRKKLKNKHKESDAKSQNSFISKRNHNKSLNVLNKNKTYNDVYNDILCNSNLKNNFYDIQDYNSTDDMNGRNYSGIDSIEKISERIDKILELKFGKNNLKN